MVLNELAAWIVFGIIWFAIGTAGAWLYKLISRPTQHFKLWGLDIPPDRLLSM